MVPFTPWISRFNYRGPACRRPFDSVLYGPTESSRGVLLMAQRNSRLLSGNLLKLGIFGANCSSGRSYNTTPERWDPTWENNIRLAQLADEAGVECMVPIARWKGYGGESDPNGTSWESITWACGLLAATRKINVFATVHVPLIHPIVAAKQMVTADHIGQGRFGVNVVCGRNDDEFEMFGVVKKAPSGGTSSGRHGQAKVRLTARGSSISFAA